MNYVAWRETTPHEILVSSKRRECCAAVHGTTGNVWMELSCDDGGEYHVTWQFMTSTMVDTGSCHVLFPLEENLNNNALHTT